MPRTSSDAALSSADASAGQSDFSELRVSPAPLDVRQPGSMRARWLIAFLYLALLGTNLSLIVDARRHLIDQARVVNMNLARAVAERLEASLAEAEHILDGLVDELEQGEASAPALVRLQPALVGHVARTEQLRGLFVYDAQGAWIGTSEPTWSPSANNADRAYFRHHRDNPSVRPLLSAPIVSRSSGQWVLPLSRRFNDAQGRFAGVVLATLSLEHYRQVLDRFDLGEGAITVTALGHYVVRRPFVATNVGQPATPVLGLLGAGDSGFGSARSPIDGIERFFSFEKTRSYPVLVIVASSKAEVLRGWSFASWLQTLWVLLLCLALWRATVYINRAMGYRMQAEDSLRKAHSAMAEVNQRLQHMAQFDGLTELPNRRYFDRRFARAFKQAQREQQPLAIVMVDVDDFKKYNDRYGHVEGDACLKQVARALTTAVRRPEDMAARYGGEEMVLLLRQTERDGASQVAETARLAVAALGIPHADSAAGHVSVSLGVASLVPGPDDTPAQLLKAADAALYEAKRGGRNRVHA